MDGRNIADFVDPDIEAKLAELEREEDLLIENSLDELADEEESKWKDAQELLAKLHKKRNQTKEEARLQKTRNHVPVPRRRLRQLEEIENQVEEAGMDSSAIRGRSATRKRKRADSDDDEDDGATARSASRARSTDVKGLPKEEDRQRAEKMRRKKQKMLEKNHKASESDRKIVTIKPKHLFSGKRGLGTKDWR
jgi:nucleolar GTP-binding protein